MDDGRQLHRNRALASRVCFRTRIVFIAIACLALLAAPRCARAYVLEAQDWASNSTILLQLGLGTPNHPLQDGSPTWNAAVAPVLDTWNQKMLRVHFTGVNNPSPPVSSGDGINAVVFASTIFGQGFGAGTLAVTYYRSQGAHLIEADVLFNSAQNFDSYRGPLQFGSNYYAIGDIRRVLLHELGHALGLNHPDSAGQHVEAVMNATVSNRETLSSDDISGIQSLYGAPVAPVVLPSSTSLLWENSQTGERQIWSMTGTIHSGTSNLGVVSTPWNIATSADFNGDGKVDVVWQHSGTGQRVIWLMNGTTPVSSVNLPTVSPEWRIASASDFNGDGKADLVWQNNITGQRVIWLMNRTTLIASINLGTVAREWKIKGSGDFNGDGKSDILWQNSLTGQGTLWLMNGSAYSASVNLSPVPAGWSIVGTGDFNGDSKRDILWQNNATGQRAVWLMNRTTYTASVSLGTVATPWNIRNY